MGTARTERPATLYGIPNCDAVKRARATLAARGMAHAFHDFRQAGVPAGRLAAWERALGWERLLNRRGTTWRALDEATRERVTDGASALALMRAQPSLIRRPVVEWPDGEITAGLDAPRWSGLLGR